MITEVDIRELIEQLWGGWMLMTITHPTLRTTVGQYGSLKVIICNLYHHWMKKRLMELLKVLRIGLTKNLVKLNSKFMRVILILQKFNLAEVLLPELKGISVV